MRQLLAQGLLAVEGDYGTLVLTEDSAAVLRSEHQVLLRREPERPRRAARAAQDRRGRRRGRAARRGRRALRAAAGLAGGDREGTGRARPT